MKIFFAVSFVCIFFIGCKDNEEIIKTKKNNFTSIEFTYRNQLDSFFDFKIDSNRLFFYPKEWNVVHYGFLPDSLFSIVDSSISYILKNAPFKKRKADLKDTSLFGIIIYANYDTVKVLQTDTEIDSIFLRMISPLESFVLRKHLVLNNAAMLLETRWMTIPAPEPPSLLPVH